MLVIINLFYRQHGLIKAKTRIGQFKKCSKTLKTGEKNENFSKTRENVGIVIMDHDKKKKNKKKINRIENQFNSNILAKRSNHMAGLEALP